MSAPTAVVDVSLRVPERALVWQESPEVTIRVTNRGPGGARLLRPVVNADVPRFRLTERRTGAEFWSQTSRPPTQPFWTELAEGSTEEHDFALLDFLRLPGPGEYDLVALVPVDGQREPAASRPVPLRVLPVTPRTLARVGARGAWAARSYGFGINAAAETPELLRHGFDLRTDFPRAVVTVDRLGPVPPTARVFGSIPANLEVVHGQWFGWVEDRLLRYGHIDELGRVLAPRNLTLDEHEVLLVGPLLSEPTPTDLGRPTGHALVWGRVDPALPAAGWREIAFSPSGSAMPGHFSAEPGPRPDWAAVTRRADGTALVAAVRAPGGATELGGFRWRPGDLGAEPPSTWARFELGFVAANLQVGEDDRVHGHLLLRDETSALRPLVVVSGECPPQGGWRETGRREIAWSEMWEVRRVRFDAVEDGPPAILIQPVGGPWMLTTPEYEWEDLAPELAGSPLPLELAFLDSHRAVVLAPQFERGWRAVRPDGSELPTREPCP